MDSSKWFSVAVVSTVLIIVILMFLASSRQKEAEYCANSTIVQTVKHEGHAYLLFIKGDEVRAAVHSESCYCRK